MTARTVGFMGKWYILTATVAEEQMILPVILVLTSVLSAGYYLPVIMAMIKFSCNRRLSTTAPTMWAVTMTSKTWTRTVWIVLAALPVA